MQLFNSIGNNGRVIINSFWSIKCVDEYKQVSDSLRDNVTYSYIWWFIEDNILKGDNSLYCVAYNIQVDHFWKNLQLFKI